MSRIAILIAFVLTGWITMAPAQEIPGTGFDKVRIARPDETIQADLHPVRSLPVMRIDADYFWYGGNTIQATRGGYSGRLLNGQYRSYYLNKNLKEMGQFKDGLKNGLWRNWQEDGRMISSQNWKKGALSGEFYLFDERGQPKQSGTYRNGQLDGWITVYNGGKTQRSYYRDGKAGPALSFWQRIDIFRKK